jgi:hypothetical protein
MKPPGKQPFSRNRGASAPGPDDLRARRALTELSARPLLYLRQLPGWLVPLALAALLIAGLALRGWPAAAALAVLAAFLGWLAALSWPTLRGRERLLRAAAITAVLAVAVIQATR